MKQMKIMAIGTLLLLGMSGAVAQSLGDYAREARKKKADTSAASHHYDNDNLPTTDGGLSVVGPQPASENNAAQAAGAASAKTPGSGAPVDRSAESRKASDDLKKKIDQQKEKLDGLNRDLDLEQREYRLRAAAFFGDAGERLRNSAQWDKDDRQFKNDIDSKQKAIEGARQQLDELQEQARKAGMEERDGSKDQDKAKGQDKDKDKDKQ